MRGRKPILTDTKRAEILAIVGVGCSRRMAALYVGCSPSTITNTADRDPAFAAELRKASVKPQLTFMKNIHDAGKKGQYWRAAAWALERLNPDDFGPRRAGALDRQEVIALLDRIARLVADEVPVARYRRRILRRLEEMIAEVRDDGD